MHIAHSVIHLVSINKSEARSLSGTMGCRGFQLFQEQACLPRLVLGQ